MLSRSHLYILLLLATGQAQTGVPQSSLAPETCSAFAHPERFVGQAVTIEANVDEDTESKGLHPGLALRPPDQCGIKGRFWFTLPENKEERDLLKHLDEPHPTPQGVFCTECPHYQLTKIVAVGKLIRVRDPKQEKGRLDIVIDFDQIGAPLYSLKIQHLLAVETKVRDYGPIVNRSIYDLPIISPNRFRDLLSLPDVLPPKPLNAVR